MQKNKLLKFISVFQIIVFSILLLVGVLSLALALFKYFEFEPVLNLVNEQLNIVNVIYLYVVYFFEAIILTLQITFIPAEFSAIIYTALLFIITLLCFVFAINASRCASNKTKGKGGAVFLLILNFLVAVGLTVFAVYLFMYTDIIKETTTDSAVLAFLVYEHEFNFDYLMYAYYAFAGTMLFISIFDLIGVILQGKKSSKKEQEKQPETVGYGSYKPKMQPQQPAPKQIENKPAQNVNKTAQYFKYQDSKSTNPYINGNAELAEEDLFGDLKPKKEEKVEPLKPASSAVSFNDFNAKNIDPIKKEESDKPQVNSLNSTFNRTINDKPVNSFMGNAPKPQSAPFSAQVNAYNNYSNTPFGQNNMGMYNQSYQMPYNNYMQNPYAQNNPFAQNVNPQPSINLTIQTPTPAQVGTTNNLNQNDPQVVSVTPKPAPKSADDAFKVAPKPAPQAVAVKKPADSGTLTDKLKELSALRQSGAISDDEYKALKQKAFQKFLKS